MNKKRVWRNVSIIISILSIPVMFFSLWSYILVERSNDIEDYISGKYLSFPGGDVIDGFIPIYEELGDYESLRFGYFDGRRRNFFPQRYYISFALCVEYSEEEYLERKSRNDVTTYDNWHIGTIDGYSFIEEGSFNHAFYGVKFNDLLNTITYGVIVGDDGLVRYGVDKGSYFSLFSWNNPSGF